MIYAGKGQKERQACTWLLSQKFTDRIAEFDMPLEIFIDNVILVSTKLKYNTKQVTSAMGIYYNREDIVNKAKQERLSKSQELYTDLTLYLNKPNVRNTSL